MCLKNKGDERCAIPSCREGSLTWAYMVATRHLGVVLGEVVGQESAGSQGHRVLRDKSSSSIVQNVT